MFETSFSKSPGIFFSNFPLFSSPIGGSRRDSSVTTPRIPSLQTEVRAVEYVKRKVIKPL